MYKFKKQERLCSVIEIRKLFVCGENFLNYPFSVRYKIEEKSIFPQVQVVIVSPKRYQKLSVNRNRAKRLIRESYRLNKEEITKFAEENNIGIKISISLVSQNIPDYKTVNTKIQKILSNIIHKTSEIIENNNQSNK